MQNQHLPERRSLLVPGWPEENNLRILIEAACAAGILEGAALNKLGYAMLDLLRERTLRLQDGECSSLPRERAERLMDSILYLIGLALHDRTAEEAITRLAETPLQQLFLEGRAVLARKTRAVGHFMAILKASALPVAYPAYQYAMQHAHRTFFSSYDADWGAGECMWTPEYMPALPLPRVGGILYLQAYLEALHTENQILRAVPSTYITQLMADSVPTGNIADPELAALTETLDPDGALIACNLCARVLDDLIIHRGKDSVWIAESLGLRGKALRYMQLYCAMQK